MNQHFTAFGAKKDNKSHLQETREYCTDNTGITNSFPSRNDEAYNIDHYIFSTAVMFLQALYFYALGEWIIIKVNL